MADAVPRPRTAYLGLGSNLGDKRQMLEAALKRLDEAPGLRVAAVSHAYRTPPWGDTDQDWYLNAAARVETTLSPHALLDACLATERALGRVRERRWGPRTIDVDVLVMDGAEACDDRLQLPHPYLLERAFVLKPLLDIAPDLVVRGVPVAAALDALGATDIAEDGELAWRGGKAAAVPT